MIQLNSIKLPNNPDARDFFKLSTLGILSMLVAAQYLGAILQIEIVSEAVSIGVAFICIFYLWLAERSGIENLRRTNIELIQARDALRISHVETILSLVLSQEAKDSYTYGHSERVKQYSVGIARQLGLPEDEIVMIGRGAKLHDIGKVGIKDEILFFEGYLTQEQYEVIKSHPAKGVAILEPLKFLENEKLIVKYHHERYDGKGYPAGLKGEQIPLCARIVCVADAFDAMKTSRPYKKALSMEEITIELVKNSGTQFDPEIINIFVNHIENIGMA